LHDTDQEMLYKFLLKEKGAIFDAYTTVETISLIDVQTLIFALKLTSLESKIPELIEKLFANENVFRHFGLLEIFESVLVAFNSSKFDKVSPLDDIYGPWIMKIFVENQLMLVKDFKTCPKEMIRKGHINTTEIHQEYILKREYENHPNEVNVWRFRSQLDLDEPTELFAEYLLCLSIYLSNQKELLASSSMCLFIEKLWRHKQHYGINYLCMTTVP
jgi:hypothetical protein